MADKARSRFVDYAVYLLVRSLILIFQLLPVSWSLKFARLAGWLACRIDKRHRLIAAENLRHAFPELSEVEMDCLVLATFRHLFTVAVETAALSRRLTPNNLSRLLRHASSETHRRISELCHSEKPVIVISGHIGNWEMLSYGLAMEGHAAAVVARPLDNPHLDRFVRRFRESTGIKIVDKTGAAEEAAQVLARGGNLGLVCDQDAGAKGLFVDFCGRPASTFKSIGLLAMKYQATILVLGCIRTGEPLEHVLFLEDEIRPEQYARNPGALKAITQRFSTALERIVRRHPEQYFWFHRRWKHQPRIQARQAA